jgi:hypothetical protein
MADPPAGLTELTELRRAVASYRTVEKRHQTRRYKLLEELLTTERHYVHMLCTCAEVYEAPLLESQLVPPALVHQLFAGLVELRAWHVRWVGMLEERWDAENAR